MSSARQSFYRYFLFVLLLVISSCKTSRNYGNWGRIESFNQLINSSKKSDYSKVVVKTQSPLLVMAIHAGKIESGTGELAREIAKINDTSLYLFEGLKAPDYNQKSLQSGHMHLTSHKFNDPEIVELARESKLCLSLHGNPSNKNDICIGGAGSLEQKQKLMKSLIETGIKTCIDCCPPYLGKNPKNVVNLCKNKGIQLEMGPNIRQRILIDLAFRTSLAKSLLRSLDIQL